VATRGADGAVATPHRGQPQAGCETNVVMTDDERLPPAPTERASGQIPRPAPLAAGLRAVTPDLTMPVALVLSPWAASRSTVPRSPPAWCPYRATSPSAARVWLTRRINSTGQEAVPVRASFRRLGLCPEPDTCLTFAVEEHRDGCLGDLSLG
jgi:hypothetical protein